LLFDEEDLGLESFEKLLKGLLFDDEDLDLESFEKLF